MLRTTLPSLCACENQDLAVRLVPFSRQPNLIYPSGYPKADHDVRDWLIGDETNPDLSIKRVHSFLMALFEEATWTLRSIENATPIDQRPTNYAVQKFYFLMSTEALRNDFFSKVVTAAEVVSAVAILLYSSTHLQ